MKLGLGKDLVASKAEKAANMESVAILKPDAVLGHSLEALVAVVLGD